MLYRLKIIGIHILAFFVARCQMLGMYPFVVPFFMAAYVQEQSSFSLYIIMLLGIISNGSYVSFIKYGLALGVLLLLLKNTDRKQIFSDNVQMALAAGVILFAFSMPFEYIVTRQDKCVFYSFLEGVIASCGTLVLEQGFIGLKVGTCRRFVTNERFIGVFALMILFLFGCPMITEPVHVLFILGAYLLLYHSYRFDSSVGMATGSVVGLVLAFRTGEIAWLVVMILLAGLIVILRELGKAGVMLGFFAGYLLLGFLYENKFLEENILISALIVLLSFMFTPEKLLRKVSQGKDGSRTYSGDLLIQEITRSKIKEFGQAFVAMEKMLMTHERDLDIRVPGDLSNVYLSGDGISLLNAVESQSNRLTQLRRDFVKQLGQIGETISGFSGNLKETTLRWELFESRITEQLGRHGIMVNRAVLVNNEEEGIEAYVACSLEKKEIFTGEMMAALVSEILSKDMVCVKRGDEMVGKKESTFVFVEKGKYIMTIGALRKNRQGETLCGDNFSVTKIDNKKAIMMISDGMGTGEMANMKSEEVVELLERLLMAGFKRELAIWLLNSFVSFLSDGSVSSTLDLTVIDLYDGCADFIKLGASTTFIKRGEKVECISSTSLPIGLMEQVEFDTCSQKLYHGDMIVMISDGIMDGVIFENKEDYLADLIAHTDTNNVQLMAQTILDDIEKMQNGRLRDDSTVLVAALWNRS